MIERSFEVGSLADPRCWWRDRFILFTFSIKRSPVFISMASRNESEDPAMPLKLKWRKKKAKEGDGDSASIASGASYRSEEGRQSRLATDGAYCC